MSLRGDCIFQMSVTCSTLTCRKTPLTTCIESAAPHARERTVMQLASPARSLRCLSPTSRSTSATRFPLHLFRRKCSRPRSPRPLPENMGTAHDPLAQAIPGVTANALAAGGEPHHTRGHGVEVADGIHRRNIQMITRGPLGVRAAHAADPPNPGLSGGPQHGRTVVDKEAPLRVERLNLTNPPPELGTLLRGTEGVGAERGIQIPGYPGLLILDLEHFGMAVCEQDQSPPTGAYPAQEVLCAGQPGYPPGLGALERLHVQSERAAPIVDAIPVHRALAGTKTGCQIGASRLEGHSSRRGIHSRDEIEPEIVIERQIEQRPIEIHQHGLNMVPVEIFKGGGHGGAS